MPVEFCYHLWLLPEIVEKANSLSASTSSVALRSAKQAQKYFKVEEEKVMVGLADVVGFL